MSSTEIEKRVSCGWPFFYAFFFEINLMVCEINHYVSEINPFVPEINHFLFEINPCPKTTKKRPAAADLSSIKLILFLPASCKPKETLEAMRMDDAQHHCVDNNPERHKNCQLNQ